jgi:predicted nuclease of predicted toxin-antitoxin system
VIRFHLDEHIDHAVARGLRDRGVDVTTAGDAGLLGAIDEEHLDFSRHESRVILTNDPDFMRLVHDEPNHAGLAF